MPWAYPYRSARMRGRERGSGRWRSRLAAVAAAVREGGSSRAGPRRLLWRAGERGERDRGPSLLPPGLALRNNRKDEVPALDDDKSPAFFAGLEHGSFFCVVPNLWNCSSSKDHLFSLDGLIITCLCSMGLRIHFVVDPQGWCCMGLIVFVWLYNTIFIPKVILFPHYEEGHISAVAILSSLVRASIADPGRLPENPKIPITEREFWELCNKCNMMRPKRSHHCSRCGHCVRRMDHHCPWINNCVGEDNHWLFLQLCFYTQILSSYTLLLDFCHYYYFLPLKKDNWDVFVFRHELALLRISAFMGIIILGGISGLFYTQLIGIFTDTTSIEKMSNCCEDISRPRKPWQQTFSEVFGTRWKILWFIPFRQRQPLRVPYHFANHV
ncbi:palmitoyltransferase ZDHHC21 isoform X2 [Coturnix japonica]|uniref:palmitoyltransferase ZDHHC21 isoform X2 n=1 Tax=Coturnix japonica TaxID=93934 RepID=UPI000777D285|nr:palmitoyltransferase ZDHHC21 isoform X2 [Coturnix japonica]